MLEPDKMHKIIQDYASYQQVSPFEFDCKKSSNENQNQKRNNNRPGSVEIQPQKEKVSYSNSDGKQVAGTKLNILFFLPGII